MVDIVNEENEVIAQASREQMRHSVCVIVQLTSSCMMAWAKFGPASYRDKRLFTRHVRCDRSGVVQADEQLLESARREAEESWALPGSPLPSTGSSISKIKLPCLGRVVQLRLSRSLRSTEDEVSEVCWLTPEEITARCDSSLQTR